MKKINIVVSVILSGLLLTGCSNSFLDVNSPTEEPVGEYFTTQEHVAQAVVAAYDPIHWTDWANNEYNPFTLMSDIMADDLWVGGSDKTDNQNWHMMMNYEATSIKVMTGLWLDAYAGVKRSNDVLKYVKNLTGEAASKNDYFIAQARVLRAFYYNWLWKFWGNVPYYSENLTESPYLAKQIQADELYTHIVEDIEAAIDLKVLPMKAATSDYGRVTLAMAYMLYAEVVMYQKDNSRYANALRYMNEIIGSTLYDLNDDYAQIFKLNGEWCDESIFEINYKSENSVRDWGNPTAAGGTVLPTLISPNNWPSGADGHNGGWGFCPVRKETYDRYSDSDTRRGATCWNAGAKGVDYNKRYQDTGLFLEKYVALAGGNEGQKATPELNYNNNWRIYRYSETLLNAAELLIRTGGSATDAKTYLNKVRKRAKLVTELEPTLDNIIEERHLEFVGEGKRYWDLIRTDKAASVLVPDAYGYRTNRWAPSKKYLPIPQSEIDKAQGTLTQNNY